MKLKYYLRGLGIGIICTAIIMGIALSGNKKETLTDAEIIERARLLGMVMAEESSDLEEIEDTSQEEDSQNPEDDQKSEDAQNKEDEPETADDNGEDSQKPEDAQNAEDQEQNADDETDTNTDNPEENQASEDTSAEMVELEIEEGDFSDVVCKKLYEAGLISDAHEFNMFLMEKGADSKLRVGVYHIPKGATEDKIAEILQGNPQ